MLAAEGDNKLAGAGTWPLSTNGASRPDRTAGSAVLTHTKGRRLSFQRVPTKARCGRLLGSVPLATDRLLSGGGNRQNHAHVPCALKPWFVTPAISGSAAASMRRTGEPYGRLATVPISVFVTLN